MTLGVLEGPGKLGGAETHPSSIWALDHITLWTLSGHSQCHTPHMVS